MSKILSIILTALIIAVILFVANLFSDLLFILYKKASKKIRTALGLPVKEEPKNEEAPSDEEPVVSKNTNLSNEILKKILSKRKNSTSDVEHPAEAQDYIEVEDYEIKE